MENELKKFLKDVQSDFCWLLYTYEYIDTRINSSVPRTADFPYCCILASQIIASFLTAHGHFAKCVATKNHGYNHCWCESEEEIIDYTSFQFSMGNDMQQKFRDGMTRRDFDLFLKNIPVIENEPEYHFSNMDWVECYEIPLLAIDEARGYLFNKDGLLSYAKDVFITIQCKLEYR